MPLTQAQSLVILLVLIAISFSPMIVLWAVRREAEDASSPPLSSVLPAREALARHLYGQAVGWDGEALEDYDHSPLVRRTWLREADRKIRRRGRRRA